MMKTFTSGVRAFGGLCDHCAGLVGVALGLWRRPAAVPVRVAWRR